MISRDRTGILNRVEGLKSMTYGIWRLTSMTYGILGLKSEVHPIPYTRTRRNISKVMPGAVSPPTGVKETTEDKTTDETRDKASQTRGEPIKS